MKQVKIFDQIDMEQHSDAWKQRFNPEVSYYGGKGAAFSPGVQAQVSAYGTGGTGEMPAYAVLHGSFVPYQFTGWMDESRSIHETGYIGDWSWLNKMILSGPDSIKCLEQSTINGYRKFPVGKGRHIISITPNGKMIGDGIAFRLAEDKFMLTGGTMVAEGKMINTTGCDVEIEDVTEKYFNYHVQGPNSKATLEKLTGEDFTDLKFIWFKKTEIQGIEVMIYRGGMSGELGYELFGDASYGSVIWKAVVEAGKEFGMRQLGYRTLMLNHLQAFFPTIWIDFVPSIVPGADIMYRSPVDYGWGNLIDKSRDFPGKDILVKEMEHPARKSVTLEWDKDDCITIYSSLFDAEEPFEQMPMPVSVSEPGGPAAPFLTIWSEDGKMIGTTTNRGYSYQFRKVISLAVIDVKYTEPGTNVYVLYGNEGERQMKVHAKVAPVPYKTDSRK